VKAYLVLSTVPTQKKARELARALVQNRLAACVNIIPGLYSIFRWQGKIDKANEFLLLIKTTKPLFPALLNFLKNRHPYKVPEIVSLPIQGGNQEYLRWIETSVLPKADKVLRKTV